MRSGSGTALRGCRRWAVVCAVAVGALAAASDPDEAIGLSSGTSRILTFASDIGTAFVADPGTADVKLLDSRNLFVLGREHGVTTLTVHDTAGGLLAAYTVRVEAESSRARAVVSRLADDAARIDVEAVGDALLVRGTAVSPAEAERVLRGIRAVAGEVPVVDALSLETPTQVNLEVLISEVSRNLSHQLGIDWSLDLNPFENPLKTWVTGTGVRLATGALSLDDTLQQTVEFYPVLPDGSIGNEPQFANEVRELAVLQPPVGRGGDGSIVLAHSKELNSSKYRASAFVEALAENGLALIHARPNLTAVSGQPAEFFSGLEIPVPSITERGTIATEYRQTGVSLTFTPTVLSREQISLVVEPRIREIAAGGASIAGTIVPNINERSAATTVELGDGESIAIAGLYRRATTSTETGVPLLKDIPLWGALFRQARERDDSVELIIVVTARIVSPLGPEAVAGLDASPAESAQRLDNEFHY